MTVDDVAGKVEAIRAVAHDDERAHCLEDDLWEEVLEAIAAGPAEEATGLAREALKTRDIQFSRWYA